MFGFNLGCGTAQSAYDNSFDPNDKYIQYAYTISDCNKDFVLTLNEENPWWDAGLQSLQEHCENGYCKREESYGFCQIHRNWWSHIVDDPRFFVDLEWQLEQCLRLYRQGTPMYGYNNRHNKKNLIIFE